MKMIRTYKQKQTNTDYNAKEEDEEKEANEGIRRNKATKISRRSRSGFLAGI